MASPSRKRARLQLRSRGRDDLLTQLVGEVRRHEKQLRDGLKHADKSLAALRAEVDGERNYSSKIKRERDSARAQLADATKELGTYKIETDKEIECLKTKLAEAQRVKNMERSSRGAALRQQTLATAQRKMERVMRATMLEYQSVFDGSGLVFDPYVESSAEEDAEVKTAEEVPQPAGSDVPHCTDSSD